MVVNVTVPCSTSYAEISLGGLAAFGQAPGGGLEGPQGPGAASRAHERHHDRTPAVLASVSCLSVLRIRRSLRRHRRRLTVIAAILALAGAVAVHHSLMDMHQLDAGMGAVVEMCLGVFTAVGATLVLGGWAILPLDRWGPGRMLLAAGALRAPPVPVARARHGPAAVCVLCVSRR
jgi:hypothetical protein